MGKHIKNRGQSASKPKQQRAKPHDNRASQELTAQSNRSDDQTHQHNIITQPGTRSISQEQCAEDVEDVQAESTMIEGRYIEADNESISTKWDSADDSTLFEAMEEVSQDTANRSLSTNSSTDPLAFHHMGACFPMSSYTETNSTGHTEQQFYRENPIATPQTATYSTFPSYNVPFARIPYQTTYTFPITTIHSQPATTLEDEPVTNQFQLLQWMHEHCVEEMTLAERMVRYNYDL